MAEVYKICMCSQSRYSCIKSFYYQFAVYDQYFKQENLSKSETHNLKSKDVIVIAI